MATWLGSAASTHADPDAPQAANPAQMLELADKALAGSQLSSQDRARILVQRGFARELLGQRAGALADFNDAISLSALGAEEQAGALYDRGVTLDELNRTSDAIEDYSAAIRLEPKFAAAYNNRGNAFRRLGRLAEAERDYEASIAAGNPHPEFPDYGLGQIAEALGQVSAAREYYRSAVTANPQFTLAADRLVAMGGGTGEGSDAPIVLNRPGPSNQPTTMAPDPSNVPKLKPAISEPRPSENRSIQLGAYRNEVEAKEVWSRMHERSGDLLASLAPVIVPVDLPGKGRWYRLRVSGFEAATASQLCTSLRAKGIACIVPPD